MRTGDLYQRYFGVYLGTVLDIEDPAALGRVRVRTDQTTDTSDDPVWATVVRPLAGDGVSAFFSPRVGDQVVVGYLVGDAREPVILGYAHSLERKPPERVAPRKPGIVTGIGSVVFDEENRKITVTFDGLGGAPGGKVELSDAMVEMEGPLGAARVVLDPTGITLAAPSIRIAGALQLAPSAGALGTDPPSGVNIDTGGKPFCINGHAVVLEEFITTIYASHVHVTGSPNTGTPVPPVPPTAALEAANAITKC